jgi:hypothetical protein
MYDDPVDGYKEFVIAFGDRRYEDAKSFLLKAILYAKKTGSDTLLAGFAQRLGLIFLKGGDRASAIVLYELSEALDKGSLLDKLNYAKFLFVEFGDPVLAKQKCLEIIDDANSRPFPESDDDFGSDYYINSAKNILQNIEGGAYG